MKLYWLFSIAALFALNSCVLASIVTSDVTASASAGRFPDIDDNDITSFGSVSAEVPMVALSSLTTTAPIVNNIAESVTISGNAAASGISNQTAVLRSNFSLSFECDFNYTMTASATSSNTASVAISTYQIEAGAQTALSSLQILSPLTLDGIGTDGTTEDFEFLVLLQDTIAASDGYDYTFDFQLVLTPVNAATCDCFTTIPEPSAFTFMSMLAVGYVGWLRRNHSDADRA